MQGNNFSLTASISAAGRFVSFRSTSNNLVSGDTNGHQDVFVRDRSATGFTSLCDPGFAGVIACPCANPASGPGRGCDNSSNTGGAILSASGIAYLSTDSLVLATAGEKPTATSIVMQGNALLANDLVFGQGVRCAGGSLKRLYTKTASGGSITAPDFGVGDPTVSSRSAALGDVIQAGESRWYLVYYRDPIVLGGCLASSTFNATQTARIDWSLYRASGRRRDPARPSRLRLPLLCDADVRQLPAHLSISTRVRRARRSGMTQPRLRSPSDRNRVRHVESTRAEHEVRVVVVDLIHA
jgi:hypothetical protein